MLLTLNIHITQTTNKKEHYIHPEPVHQSHCLLTDTTTGNINPNRGNEHYKNTNLIRTRENLRNQCRSMSEDAMIG